MLNVVTLAPVIFLCVFIPYMFWRVSKGTGRIPLPGANRAKQAKAEQLQATGRKARATILNIQPTGVIVNHLNLGLNITFGLTPLDGGTPFQASKTMTLNQTRLPRVGDVWPAWIDTADPTVFAVASPAGTSPEQIALWREFGIPHPLDPTTAAPPAGVPVAPAAPGADPRVESLERIAALHRSGALTDAEFAAEKSRLLGGG